MEVASLLSVFISCYQLASESGFELAVTVVDAYATPCGPKRGIISAVSLHTQNGSRHPGPEAPDFGPVTLTRVSSRFCRRRSSANEVQDVVFMRIVEAGVGSVDNRLVFTDVNVKVRK